MKSSLTEALQVYIVKAAQANYLTVDGKYVLVTEAGKKEIDSILSECLTIMTDAGEDVQTAVDTYNAKSGNSYTTLEFLGLMLKSLTGSEVMTLAFLLGERDANFKFLKETMVDMAPKKEPRLSVVSTKKWDA